MVYYEFDLWHKCHISDLISQQQQQQVLHVPQAIWSIFTAIQFVSLYVNIIHETQRVDYLTTGWQPNSYTMICPPVREHYS